MSEVLTNEKLRLNLRHFNGSDSFIRWSPLFPKWLLTEGAEYLAENCGAYWLMDAIASWQQDPKVRAEDFQAWTLTPADGGKWLLRCDDGNGSAVASQGIEFSDFPLPEGITLWAIRNELDGFTIMLPTEY